LVTRILAPRGVPLSGDVVLFPKKSYVDASCVASVLEDIDSMELACDFDEKHWNKGIAAAACTKVLEYCFKTFGSKRIQGRSKVENILPKS
jgi:RimJ/RimL family protein N-acetyltransferase